MSASTFVYLPDRRTFLNLAHIVRVELDHRNDADIHLTEYDAFGNSRVKVILTQTEADRDAVLAGLRRLTVNAQEVPE